MTDTKPIPGGTRELTAEQTADLQAKAEAGNRQAQRELSHRHLVDAAADLLYGKRDPNGRKPGDPLFAYGRKQ
jgi:hypothetical protein